MTTPIQPTLPRKKRNTFKKVLLIIFGAPFALAFVLTIFGSIISAFEDYSLSVTQGGGKKTESTQAEFTITAKKQGKVKINGRELSLQPNVEIKPTVPLQYGKNKVTVVINVAGKEEQKDYVFYRMNPTEIQARKDEEAAAECSSSPEKYVVIVRQNWSRGGFGAVAEHTVLVRNDCPIPLKDIEFTATYYAPSGSRIDSTTRKVYQRMAPKSSQWMKFSGFVHEQANKASVEVSDASVTQ